LVFRYKNKTRVFTYTLVDKHYTENELVINHFIKSNNKANKGHQEVVSIKRANIPIKKKSALQSL